MEIRLVDVVLLSCEFAVWPDRPGASEEDDDTGQDAEGAGTGTADEHLGGVEAGDEQSFTYPDEEFLELSVSATQDDDEYVVIIKGRIDDASFPFRMKVTVGSRFTVEAEEGEERPSIDDLEGTFMWLSYPYLRETISSISGRSPLPPYFVQALTRMPHPSVSEGE